MSAEIELRAYVPAELSRPGIDILSVNVSAHPDQGVLIEVMFPNGYGASVIRTDRSYGGRSGLFELAVLNENGDIAKDTSVTRGESDHVMGWLTATEVLDLFRRIAALD